MRCTVTPMTTQNLEVDVVRRDDAVLVTVEGYGGFDRSQRLAEVLAQVVRQRPRRVVMDLSSLDFVSSVAAGVLASFRHALTRRGCRLQVIDAESAPRTRQAGTACHTRT